MKQMNRRISERPYSIEKRCVLGGVDAVIRHDMETASILNEAEMESHANFDSTSSTMNSVQALKLIVQ